MHGIIYNIFYSAKCDLCVLFRIGILKSTVGGVREEREGGWKTPSFLSPYNKALYLAGSHRAFRKQQLRMELSVSAVAIQGRSPLSQLLTPPWQHQGLSWAAAPASLPGRNAACPAVLSVPLLWAQQPPVVGDW